MPRLKSHGRNATLVLTMPPRIQRVMRLTSFAEEEEE